MKTTKMTTQAEELRAGQTIIVNTVGTSMRPLLRENETQVVIAPLRRRAKKGDILLYESRNDSLILHRVIAVAEKTVTLRGDNELLSETIPHERIVGLATEVFRHGRRYPAESREMRLYALFAAAAFPLRKGARTLRHKLASTLPKPMVNAVRAIIKKYRR